MASEHTFDIVSKVNLQEVLNAVEQSMKEIHQRFDFKGSKSNIELDQGKSEITIISDDEYYEMRRDLRDYRSNRFTDLAMIAAKTKWE